LNLRATLAEARLSLHWAEIAAEREPVEISPATLDLPTPAGTAISCQFGSPSLTAESVLGLSRTAMTFNSTRWKAEAPERHWSY